MKIAKIFLVVAILVFSVSSLTACNTVRGMGQDVQATGQAISTAAT